MQGKSKSKIDPKFQYQSLKIVCSHHGVPRKDRCKGERPNQHVFPNKCPFSFRISFKQHKQKLVLLWSKNEHKNHPISRELKETGYRVKE